MLFEYQSKDTEGFTYPSFTHELKTIYNDTNKALRIRNMSLAELIEARVNWTIPEGWPGVKYILGATYANDPNGFYLLEKDDLPIACISVVTYPEIHLGFIGFYVVDKPFRGQGYGKLLITKVIQHTEQKRGIRIFGLDCLEQLVAKYSKYGFKTFTHDNFWRYSVEQKLHPTQKVQILNTINSELFANILAYDTDVLGTRRQDFLENFLFKPSTTTVIAQEAEIIGYGVMSEREPAIVEQNKSFRIGPIYANNKSIAQNILCQLVTHLNPDESAFLETPGNNPNSALIMDELGWQKTLQQARMYRGEAPSWDITRMFCYNSIAVGG